MSDRFLFCLPVWGEAFVDAWLDVALPTLLAPGNLGDFPWASTSVLEIYTRAEDTRRMEESPAFRKLRSLMRVRFVGIDDLSGKSTFGVYTECQRRAIRAADESDSVLSFLSPDMITSAGTLLNAARRIRDGATAFVMPGNRVNKEQMVPWLRERLSTDRTTIAIGSRDLVRQSFAFEHANTEAWFWNSKRFDRTPAYLMWRVPDAGLVAYCYVLHPMMMKAEVKGAPLLHIYDQDFLEAACPTVERIHVSRDSDEAFIVGIDSKDRFDEHLIDNQASPYDLAYWAEWAFNDHHRAFARVPLRHRYADGREEDWAKAEAEGRAAVDAIASVLAVPDWQLALLDRRRLLVRLRRRYRYKHKDLYKADFVWSVIEKFPRLAHQIDRFRGHATPADMAALEWLAIEEERPSAAVIDAAEMDVRYKMIREVVARLKEQDVAKKAASWKNRA